MRIGLLEIVATVIIIIAILLVVRIARTRPGASPQNKKPSTAAISKQAKNVPGKRTYLKKLGLAFLAVGILFALSGISMFRWAIQVYLWSFIIVVLGLALLFLSRKK